MYVYMYLSMPQIAMPWLQLGFVGLLEVDQTLILWDRVIGMYVCVYVCMYVCVWGVCVYVGV
jgi:hypothetical protein